MNLIIRVFLLVLLNWIVEANVDKDDLFAFSKSDPRHRVKFQSQNSLERFLKENSDFDSKFTKRRIQWPNAELYEEELRDRKTKFIYHKYESLEGLLKMYDEMCSQNGVNLSYSSLGKSVQQRELWYTRISTKKVKSLARPAMYYIGNIHGDEVVGREVLLHFIEQICKEYPTNSDIERLIDYADIFIVPSMNPDGFEHGTRENANGKDMNRNFPDQYKDKQNSLENREVEVQHVMKFLRSHPFILGANLHGGSLVANYPFDCDGIGSQRTEAKAPDDAMFKQLALAYSKNHLTMHQSTEFEDGITNGNAWYCLFGGLQDYAYLYENHMHLTLELSEIKTPAESELENFWNQNKPALLSFASQVFVGANGFILSDIARSGIPNANITVKGINFAFQTKTRGDYYRLLTPGNYRIQAISDGFIAESSDLTIPVNQKEPVSVNFILSHPDEGDKSKKSNGTRTYVWVSLLMIASTIGTFIAFILLRIIYWKINPKPQHQTTLPVTDELEMSDTSLEE